MASSSTRHMIAAFSAGFTAMILAIFLFTVWKSHSDLKEHTYLRVQELTRALEEHVIRTFRSVDHTLDTVASQVSIVVRQSDPGPLKGMLRHYAQSSEEISHLIFLDPLGQRLAYSDDVPVLSADGLRKVHSLANRQGGNADDLDVVLVRDAPSGRWFIAVAQAIQNMDGKHLGSVVGLVPSKFIDGFYRTFSLDDLDSMSVFHVDGTALARIPFPGKLVGRSFAKGKLFSEILPNQPRGVSEAPQATDGIQRLVSHAKITGLPFIVTVGIKQDRILSAWWMQFNVLLPVFLAAIVVVWGLTLALVRYLGRLQTTETNLSQEMEFTNQLLNREGALLLVLDEVGRITRINDMTRTVTGYEDLDLLGQAFATSILADTSDWNLDRIRAEVQVRDEVYQREMVWRSKDGTTFTMLCSLTLMKDQYGRSPLLVVSAVDVSERVQREEELRTLANMDALTGILNRRQFYDLGEREFKKAMRLGHDMAVLVLDPDDFKAINDNWGHLAGDAALKALSDLVKDNLREIDVFGRIGGDEFAVVLPETRMKDALQIAERIRKAAETKKITYDDMTLSFTISIGVGVLDVIHADFTALIKDADKALYGAKQQGRNRVLRVTLNEDSPMGSAKNGPPVQH